MIRRHDGGKQYHSDRYERSRCNKPRLKENTWLTKESIIQKKIVPYFGKRTLCDITAKDVIEWQNEIRNLTDKGGKSYSSTYLKTVHNQLSAMFNHAVRYYGLKSNPAAIAGNMGVEERKEMLFWTLEEYKKFYYEKIRSGKQEKPFHELILQIGNCDDTAVGTETADKATEALKEYFSGFQERNPHLRVFSAHLHLDEHTPHIHIDFVPFTTGSRRGHDTRVSLKQALLQQGFKGDGKRDNEWKSSIMI